MNKLNLIAGAALIGLLIFTLGHASYEDAKEEQDMYCKMVAISKCLPTLCKSTRTTPSASRIPSRTNQPPCR